MFLNKLRDESQSASNAVVAITLGGCMILIKNKIPGLFPIWPEVSGQKSVQNINGFSRISNIGNYIIGLFIFQGGLCETYTHINERNPLIVR